MKQTGDIIKITTVDLPEDQAEQFKLFMQYYDKFMFLFLSGVFEIQRGNATIHFKDNGDIQSVEKKTFIYEKDLTTKPNGL